MGRPGRKPVQRHQARRSLTRPWSWSDPSVRISPVTPACRPGANGRAAHTSHSLAARI
jgi:hypothetical protein